MTIFRDAQGKRGRFVNLHRLIPAGQDKFWIGARGANVAGSLAERYEEVFGIGVELPSFNLRKCAFQSVSQTGIGWPAANRAFFR